MNLDSVVEYGEMGLGGFGAAALTDSVVMPFAEKLLPQLQTDHTTFKIANTVATGVASIGLGKVFRAVGLGRIGRAFESGGLVVTALKAWTIPIPALEATVSAPSPLGLFRAFGMAAPSSNTPAVQGSNAPAQLPAASSAASGGSSIPFDAVPVGYGAHLAPNQQAGM